MEYTEHTTDSGNVFIVRANDDGTISWIPKDEANSDYQAYLNKDKLAEQSTPSLENGTIS